MQEEISLARSIKLQENNWTNWKFQLTVHANSKDALDTISTPIPAQANEALKRKYTAIYTYHLIELVN